MDHYERWKKITEEQAQRNAEAIVNDLMTNGQGDKATRLVLVDDAYVPIKDLGGWSREALIRRITKILVGG